MKAQDIIQRLNLRPHPEGGYYREVYRSTEDIPRSALPGRYDGDRTMQTAIYYLLTADTVSRLHRIQSDEIFHFYRGDAARMLLLFPDGNSETVTLGSNIAEGERPLRVVKSGTWFGLYLDESADYALLGTTVSPGFEFDDFEMGEVDCLIGKYPDQSELIRRLT